MSLQEKFHLLVKESQYLIGAVDPFGDYIPESRERSGRIPAHHVFVQISISSMHFPNPFSFFYFISFIDCI